MKHLHAVDPDPGETGELLSDAQATQFDTLRPGDVGEASDGGGRTRSSRPLPRRRLAAIVAVLVVVVAAVAFLLLRGTTSANAVYVQPVSLVNMGMGSASANRYSGVVEALESQKVTLDPSRTLGEVKVKAGDHVNKGDVLFTYDTQATELELQKAQIQLERLEQTISDGYEQISSLQGSLEGASDELRLDYAAQIQDAQASVAQAEYDRKIQITEISKLQATIADPGVHAQVSGTVESVADVQASPAGMDEAAGDGSGTSTDQAFISILADGDFRVRGTVSEQNIYEFSQGQAVIVRSRIDEEATWAGTVSSVDSQPAAQASSPYTDSQSNGASNYNFYVILDSSDNLMLGQHVTIEADYAQGEAKDGIWLDSAFIVTEGDGSTYVWATRSEGGRLEKRPVSLGELWDELGAYQIASGLDESDLIAYPSDECSVGARTTTALSEPDEALSPTGGEPTSTGDGSAPVEGESAPTGAGSVSVEGEPLLMDDGSAPGEGELLPTTDVPQDTSADTGEAPSDGTVDASGEDPQ